MQSDWCVGALRVRHNCSRVLKDWKGLAGMAGNPDFGTAQLVAPAQHWIGASVGGGLNGGCAARVELVGGALRSGRAQGPGEVYTGYPLPAYSACCIPPWPHPHPPCHPEAASLQAKQTKRRRLMPGPGPQFVCCKGRRATAAEAWLMCIWRGKSSNRSHCRCIHVPGHYPTLQQHACLTSTVKT